MCDECCKSKAEEVEECEHHFVKLNDNQIFCEDCGEIRGNGTVIECKKQCFHYCTCGCGCNHWKYYTPQWTYTSPTTITYTDNTTTFTPLPTTRF